LADELGDAEDVGEVADALSAKAVSLRMPARLADDVLAQQRPGSEGAGRGVLAAA